MTYSIVSRDPQTGRFGIAIQTRWPFVGAGCPWVESGVGAVVTQSFTEVAHGPNGLARLRDGDAAPAALAALLAADPGEAVRQVGIVDAAGRSAAHTGSRCVQAAGHLAAEGVSVQANMMERPTVWPAMLDAWSSGGGDFVVVVNAEKVRVTGRKEDQKMYYRHSGYPGGFKAIPYRRMMGSHPDRILRFAVKGMLPKTRLGRQQLLKLKIYAGPTHPHAAQQPTVYEPRPRG